MNRLIFLQCRQGKRDGFDLLVSTWQKPLFYYVRQFVQREEDAWDVMQEAWICVIRGIGSVKNAETLPAWLYTVARNTAINHLRAQGRWKSMTEVVDEEQLTGISDSAPEDYKAKSVHEALDSLEILEREALTLHFLEGYQVKEIAQITGEPIGTISSRMYRAKRNLRRIIDREESQ